MESPTHDEARTGHDYPVSSYNYERDPRFAETERIPNVSNAGMPTEEEIARNNGVPPIAIPYMTLHNCTSGRESGKQIIVPMVVGFESTFLANCLQGLLCLPGCESVFMGKPVHKNEGNKSKAGGRSSRHRQQDKNSNDVNANEEETGGVSMDEADEPSARSSPPRAETAADASAPWPAARGSSTSSNASSRSASSAASDASSLSPFYDGPDAQQANEEGTYGAGGRGTRADPTSAAAGGEGGAVSSNSRVLRGGIRCHGTSRSKTALSRNYADFVLQHLEDGEIQLKTPAPRSTSTLAVSDKELDEAGELETLRGQTPNVPRCLAPVSVPGEHTHGTAWNTNVEQGAGKGSATSTSASPRSSSQQQATSAAAAGVFAPDTMPASVGHRHASVVNEQTKVLLTTSEHSCSDNSPTPSSAEAEEEMAGGGGDAHVAVTAAVSAEAHDAATAEPQVGLRHGAQDGRRYTCFASNSVDNMPVFPFTRMMDDDLAEMTAYMVVRSSVQPNEAVDLDLASHILGNPEDVERLPPELRGPMVKRAMRLMRYAVYLQI